MAFSNIDSLNLGNLLQILFTNEVYNQISQDFRDLEYVKRATVKSSVARELRFMLQTSFGPAAIQYRNPGTSDRAFPAAQQATVAEKTAKFKELNATIELEYNLWDRARKSPEKYGEPLAIEIMSKTTAAKRRIAADFFLDGTGVLGTVASTSDTTGSGAGVDKAVVSLSTSDTARGHVGAFEFGDLILVKNTNGTADNPTVTGTFYAYKVIDKDRDNLTVTLQPVDSSGAALAMAATSIDATDLLYRVGQPTFPDLSSTVSDYGLVSEVMAGLESLVASDGRVIHGITMSGATAGSRLSAGAAAIDVSHIHKAMDKAKTLVGQDRYSWKQMIMAPETLRALIESRETDRRFNAMQDNKRGTTGFFYQHLNDSLEAVSSEFCPMKRIYMIPEAKNGKKVLEFRGSEFETIKGQGMTDWHLKAGSSGYVNSIQSFLQAIGVFIATHPAAVAVVHNFTNS